MPIHGPYNHGIQNADTFLVSTRYKTTGRPRPNTPYFVNDVRARGRNNQGNGHNVNSVLLAWTDANLRTKTYDKFWGRVHERANLGISLFESKKSFQMVALRGLQMYRALRSLDLMRFGEAAGHLGLDVSRRPKVKRRPGKQVSDLWLEYTFGWVPLITDVYQACQVLQQDFDVFRGSAKVTVPVFNHYDDGGSRYALLYQCSSYYKAKVRVTNPNLLLANQLGVLNPAHIAWDAVPFSFVVDWFLPVGKFLQSWTNGVGLELLNPVWGSGIKGNGVGWHVADGPTSFNNKAGARAVGTIPTPGLLSRVRLPNVDPWLAITSWSLLTQQLERHRR